MTGDDHANDAWQARWLDAVQEFATFLKEHDEKNPWADLPMLTEAVSYLMTELWDRGFTQTQIREALSGAIVALPGYAAGEETHGVPTVAPSRPLPPDRFEGALTEVARTYRALATKDSSLFTSGLPLENNRSRIWVMAERQLQEALEDLRAQKP